MSSITNVEAENILQQYYQKTGTATLLYGELDLNFKVKSTEPYILKVSNTTTDENYLAFQTALHLHIEKASPSFLFPKIIATPQGDPIIDYKDQQGLIRKVRLLSWIEGRLWSSVNPITTSLRENLGKACGLLTNTLQSFDHAYAHRNFDWNLSDALWTVAHHNLFEGEQLSTITYFQDLFKQAQPTYTKLRHSVIHNDVNDNNIIVSHDKLNPTVMALIDYGDAVYSQSINDVAVTLAYGIMRLPDPLTAAAEIVKGYHETFPLLEEELELLYTLVAMRLVISVTKSAQNKIQHPENTYLQISDADAWNLLHKWKAIHPNYAYYSFRAACGLSPCPQQEAFKGLASKITPLSLFANQSTIHFEAIDLSMSSTLLGNFSEYKNDDLFNEKIMQLVQKNPTTIFAGGYGEARPFYTTSAFKLDTNEGKSHRTIHLGVDFWAIAETEVLAPLDGEIVTCYDNDFDKDYGPTIILKHTINEQDVFFTLYGHLSKASLTNKHVGQKIKQGTIIGTLGNEQENGKWPPHLHFQIILDLLSHTHNFNGVCSPAKWNIFSSLCPNPNQLLGIGALQHQQKIDFESALHFRKQHLGKSLSLSYQKHLHIVRGEACYLFDDYGQAYLDTVNNVAHVGHEHTQVVKAGQQQMAVLNTNTRYLHPEILKFTEELLAYFPPELCVVHFVNSGSEANELALRMAKTVTGRKDIIALEMGYHGNTQACVDVSSYKFNRKGGSGKPEHTSIVPLPDAFRGLYRGADSGTKYAQHLQIAIDELKTKGRNVAAFLAESIVSCGGQIDLPKGYLEEAYKIVRNEGGLCIADEVQVGFGRVGTHFWGFEMHDVVPDIVVLGKPIGNGHPLGAVVCTRAVADGFANGMEFFNTFGGNPVSCAIGRAVLDVIKTEGLQQHAKLIGDYLTVAFNDLKTTYPIIADIRGRGLFLGIELMEKDFTPATAKTAYIAERMKERGVLMSVDGPDNNVLKIKPPLCFSKTDADLLLENLILILQEDFTS
jgi:4-aminobutyrate aminotransferase-like enzyme/Ser/Thr protein kinase RdoA (MazF antagonist)/murein DD-endopeptidase MepM/ murein hydrolase activator NlpD